MTFLLDPPPEFNGLDTNQPVEIYTRHLPHWRQTGAPEFDTFHQADALPATKRTELCAMRAAWLSNYPPPHGEVAQTKLAATIFNRVEQWVDAGHGSCWFRSTKYAAVLQRCLLHNHNRRYELGCFVIMANHCHLVIRPLSDHALETEVGAVKSIAANFVSRDQNLNGKLWQEESYDRIIRDPEHLYRVVQYIGNNPRRAGIPGKQWHRWINPRWQQLGWDFVDP